MIKIIYDSKRLLSQARLKAIEELNKKREEKRKLQQQILQEELQLTTETNKTKKKIVKRAVTPKTGINKHSPPKKEVQKVEQKESETKLENTTKTDTTDTTYDNLVEEIFLTNTRQVTAAADSDVDTPRAGWQPETGSSSGTPPAPRSNTNEGAKSGVRGSISVREEKKAFTSLLETLKMLEVESEEALSEAKSSSIIIPPTPKLTQGEVYRWCFTFFNC